MQDSCSLGNNKVSALDRTLGEISRILEKEVLLLLPCNLRLTYKLCCPQKSSVWIWECFKHVLINT